MKIVLVFSLLTVCWIPSAQAWDGFVEAVLAPDWSPRLDSAKTAVVAGRGGLMRVSDKSREIARRLDRTGYYSRLSRAYKGYPHLRSKPAVASAAGAGSVGVSFENRRLYRSQLRKIAGAHRLAPELLDAIIVVESGYHPDAVSPKGAMGLMQLMPDTAKRFEVEDPFDPAENMRGGARYLRWLMDRFDGELKLALAAYNAGEGAVERHGNQIPPYQETQGYVVRVLNLYDRGRR